VTYRYSQRSLAKLNTCHPDLQLLMQEALADPECPCDITIVEGHRNQERQDRMVEEGKSQLRWPHSRHNLMPSMAVDVVAYRNGGADWSWEAYDILLPHLRDTWARLVADELVTGQYAIEFGADWPTLRDGPHVQLNPL
jgi:peptidoglycan L-alanyl-D-glutamate endopeptidase CwlK